MDEKHYQAALQALQEYEEAEEEESAIDVHDKYIVVDDEYSIIGLRVGDLISLSMCCTTNDDGVTVGVGSVRGKVHDAVLDIASQFERIRNSTIEQQLLEPAALSDRLRQLESKLSSLAEVVEGHADVIDRMHKKLNAMQMRQLSLQEENATLRVTRQLSP